MKHSLIVDRKVTTWIREKVEVEAESIEEAIEKIKKDSYDIDMWDREEFIDCEEQIHNSNNEPVIEIMNDKYEIIYSSYNE